MRLATLALGSLLVITALSAHAGDYTTINYKGHVKRVGDAADGPADIQPGTLVTFTATFDPAKFIEFSPHLTDGLTGAPLLLQTGGATIYGDPLASYTITVGAHTFTSATDQGKGFVNPDNGAGPFPFVAYQGSQLLGIEADSIVDGLEFQSVPGQFLLEEHRHVGIGSSTTNGDYFFLVDTTLDDAIVAAREQGLAAAAVPEPSSWALLLAGIGGLAVARRRTALGRAEASGPIAA